MSRRWVLSTRCFYQRHLVSMLEERLCLNLVEVGSWVMVNRLS
jgi:hypothetical protein